MTFQQNYGNLSAASAFNRVRKTSVNDCFGLITSGVQSSLSTNPTLLARANQLLEKEKPKMRT